METFNDTKSYGIFSTAANRKLIKDLEGNGAKVFQFPVIETESVESEEIVNFLKNNLVQVDWLVFTDIFSVDYFIEVLDKSEIDLFELDEKRILVFGEAIADRLRFSQIHADIIPASADVGDIVLNLSEYLQTDNLAGIKFVMPIFSGFENYFGAILKNNNAEVIELEIYRLMNENNKESAKLFALLKGGAIDEFIFSAPEDIFYLNHLVYSQTLNEVLNEIDIFATNEITIQTLHEYKLNSEFYQNK